jgi:outer membrane receptor protein involved in Fe transport
MFPKTTPQQHHIFVAVVLFLQYSLSALENQSDISSDALNELSLSTLLSMEISTGSFLDLNLQKSPLSMTIITSEMVKASGARHMSELLDIYVPGFIYNYNKWNGTLWAMRGVSNDRNTKIIYLVNSHKMNTQARDGFQSEVVLGLLDEIERVEVLRGPAGLVYGAGAIAGIVNVVTRSGENKSVVSTGTGTDNSRSIEGNLSCKPGKDQQLNISLGIRSCDGLPYDAVRIYGTAGWPFSPGVKEGGPAEGKFGYNEGNWKVTTDWSLGERINIYARMTHQTEALSSFFITDLWPDYEAPPPNTVRPINVDGVLRYYNDPYWSTVEAFVLSRFETYSDNFFAEGAYTLPLELNLLKLKLSYDLNTTSIKEYVLSKWENSLQKLDGQIYETFGESRYTVNGSYLVKSVPGLQAAIGLEYRLDAVGPDMQGKNERLGNSKHYVVKDINYHTGSAFAEGLYDFNELFAVHAGARLDIHTRAVMFNPKLALITQPSDNHTLKLIYQSASNNGSVDNYEYGRFHVNDNGEIITTPSWLSSTTKPDTTNAAEANGLLQPVPNEDILHELKPEIVHSVEACYVGKFMKDITLEPSVTWGMIKNLLAWEQLLYRGVNVGTYQYANIDLDTRYTGKKFKMGINHTYQRPVFTDPDKQTKEFTMYEATDSAGLMYVYTGLNTLGDSTYRGWYSKTKTMPLNVVKNTITYDGKNFLNIPTNLTKIFMIYSPLEWLSVSASLRLVWGIPGREPLLATFNDTAYYYGFYHELEDQSLRDYIMRSVSKKLNIGLIFSLPFDIDVNIYAYNILGTDQHEFGGTDANRTVKLDRNTVNTFRLAQGFALDQRDLYSTDQRTFAISLSKQF